MLFKFSYNAVAVCREFFGKKTRMRKTCVVILFFLSLEVSEKHFFAVGRWQDKNSTKDEMPLACLFVIQPRSCGHDERKNSSSDGRSNM